MAVAIPFNLPTNDPNFFDKVRGPLVIRPKPKFFAFSSKGGGKGGKGRMQEEPPIYFYLNLSNHIRIPYAYASMILGKAYNFNLHHAPTRILINEGKKLRDYQVSIVQESLANLQTYGTNTLICPPGFGKTGMTCFLSSLLFSSFVYGDKGEQVTANCVVCVLIHRDNIMKQWVNSFRAFTNANVWVVGTPFPSLPPEKGGVNVIICMKDRVKHIPESIIDKIGFLVVDEVHRFCTPSCVDPILSFRPRFISVCTATPNRSDGMDAIITALCGKHRVVREFQGHFHYRQVETNLTFEAPNNPDYMGGGVRFSTLMNNVFASAERNQMIVNCVKQIPSKKILIITTYVKNHAQPLYEMIRQSGEDVSMFAGDEDYVDARVCVASCGKSGEGMDPSSLTNDPAVKQFEVLFNVTSFKSELLWEQVVGRVLRVEESWVYDFVDNHPTLQKHAKYRRKWCLSHGGQEF